MVNDFKKRVKQHENQKCQKNLHSSFSTRTSHTIVISRVPHGIYIHLRIAEWACHGQNTEKATEN